MERSEKFPFGSPPLRISLIYYTTFLLKFQRIYDIMSMGNVPRGTGWSVKIDA
nr:MAG TPA: hypothetical protein [Caudoviricetes sp.]